MDILQNWKHAPTYLIWQKREKLVQIISLRRYTGLPTTNQGFHNCCKSFLYKLTFSFMRTKLDFSGLVDKLLDWRAFFKENIAFISITRFNWEVSEAFGWTVHYSYNQNAVTVSDLHWRVWQIHENNFPSPTRKPWKNNLHFVGSGKLISQFQYFKFYRKDAS